MVGGLSLGDVLVLEMSGLHYSILQGCSRLSVAQPLEM